MKIYTDRITFTKAGEFFCVDGVITGGADSLTVNQWGIGNNDIVAREAIERYDEVEIVNGKIVVNGWEWEEQSCLR